MRRGRAARFAAALALVCGVAATPAGGAAALGATAETLTCVPLERIELVPVAGDRYYHRTGGATDGPMRYSAGVREEIFPKGAPVDLTLTLHNAGPAAVTFSFATSQRVDVVLYDDNCREIWRWSRGRMFAQVIGRLTVAPGAIVTYRVRWDQRDQSGRPVRLGAYEARVVFLGRRMPRANPVVLSPLEFAVR
ncbi:MAG TPA: BsuPI-related putative proteinase inhibitor [bacterium]|nr:BsuPI-related putative proteinase inhibitor [bacterium]